jgi:hypothetical protein
MLALLKRRVKDMFSSSDVSYTKTWFFKVKSL